MALRNCRNVKVLDITPVGQSPRPDEFFELRLERPDWDDWKPGQFVMIRPVDWPMDLLWGRPFSICSGDAESVTLFVQKIGRGTTRLSELKKGDTVAMWGPLGNSFAVDATRPTLMLAGGIGIAPFRGYVEQHPLPENLKLFFAHRMAIGCYPYQRLSDAVDAECMMEARREDLAAIIERMGELVGQYRDGLILCCGPTPFMKTAQKFALEAGAELYVSLENRMACGVGACLGCVCKDGKGHHTQVCTKGPIFRADNVEL
ncbi:hypothetical protein [Desulfovibrio oxyclinae]|uniref:iron-sulfur cluster-binding protein n=1 Tax=Desulfovibrio oxyclinae TaxID=63560 RepID=UPI00037BF914|nr:hypothetical protein [Desulfovibrio oxyclinae]